MAACFLAQAKLVKRFVLEGPGPGNLNQPLAGQPVTPGRHVLHGEVELMPRLPLYVTRPASPKDKHEGREDQAQTEPPRTPRACLEATVQAKTRQY